jgi:hypothetical protein
MTGIAMNAMGMDPEYVNPHHIGELNKQRHIMRSLHL